MGRFKDAQNDVRCKANIKLKDGSAAQCGRREAWDGLGLCWQHQRKAEPQCTCRHDVSNGAAHANECPVDWGSA